MKSNPVSTFISTLQTTFRRAARLGIVAVTLILGISLYAFPNITNVVETGGDNEATDTITAKWTGTWVTNFVDLEYPASNPYLVPLFGENVRCFVDRNHSWRSTNSPAGFAMPPYLIGGEYIMSGNDNRDNTNYVLDISIAVPSYVYVAVDNRLGDGLDADPPNFTTNMTWLLPSGWVATANGLNRSNRTDLPDEVFQDNDMNFSIEDEYSVYVKMLPAGTFQTFQADNASRGMYLVVVKEALPAPTLTVAKRDGALNLTWLAVAGATSYNVKRATTAGGPYTTITNTTATALLDEGLVNGTTYYYVINAAAAIGEGFDSAEVNGTPNPAVTDLTATLVNGAVNLSWPAAAGATTYNVKRATTAGGPYTVLNNAVADITYTDASAQNGNTYYYVVSGNFTGGEGVDSPERSMMMPPAITTQPVGVSIPDGNPFSLTVAAVGQGTLTYQWYQDGNLISGAQSATYSVASSTTNDSGAYVVVVANASGSVTSDVANVSVVLSPFITAQPAAISYFQEGTLGGITVLVRGQTPLSIQWQMLVGGEWQEAFSDIPSQSNSFARIAWLAADTGDYRAVITNDLGAVTSAVASVVVVLPITITNQPVGAVAEVGASVTFTVGAEGNELRYQWLKDGSAISGATSASYTIDPTQVSSEGNYSVVVSNQFYSATSDQAFLDMKFAPVFTTSPANQSAVIGGSATFTVAVNADPAANLQWQLNGIDIPGANGTTYTVNNANMPDVGLYGVVAVNDRGTTTSAAGALSVNYPAPTVLDPFPSVANFQSSYFTNAGNYNWVSSGGVNNSSALDVPNNADGSAVYTNRSFDFSQPGKVIGLTVMVKLKSNGGTQRIMQFGLVQNNNSRPNADADKQWMTLRWDTTGTGQETTIRYQNKYSTSGTIDNDGVIIDKTRTLVGRWFKVVAWFENVGGGNYKMSGGVWEYGTAGTVPGRMVLYFPEVVLPNPVLCTDSSVWAVFRGNNDTGTDNIDDFAIYEGYRPLPLISSAPLSQTVNVGSMASFRVGLEGSLLAVPQVQWYRNGVAIPGADNINYTTPALSLADNGALFSVVARSSYGAVTSSVAKLTVTGTDTTGPTVVSAGSVNPSVVGVAFSETLDPATAQNPANYTVTGAPVGRAILRPDGKSVRLELSSPLPGTAFSVTVANVADVSGNVGGGTVASTAWTPGWFGTNVGYPLVNGTVDISLAPGQVEFSAGGADIWGNSDNGFMFLNQRTGDFDVKVRVDEIVRAPERLIMEVQNSSDLAKFGLIARDELYSASPQITFHPFPPAGTMLWQGLNRFEAGRRNTPGEGMGTFWNGGTPTVNFPNCWIRLRRSGDTFDIYNSHDGLTWTYLAQHVKANTLPTMWVGLSGTAHFNANWYMGSASGRFSEFGDFAYPGASVAITTDLAPTANVTEGGTLALTIAASATIAATNNANAEIRYVWQRQLAGGAWENVTNINASTATTYTTGALRYGVDNGVKYRCIVRVPGAEAISAETVVTIADTAAPTLVSAAVMPGQTNGLVLTFSERVNAATATELNNYIVLDNVATFIPVESATVLGDGTKVVLTFAGGLTVGANYSVTIDNVTDLAGNFIAGGTTGNFMMADPMANPVQVEIFTSMPNFGGRVQDVLALPRVLAGLSDRLYYTNQVGLNFPNFVTAESPFGDNYVSRTRGYFVPAVSGNYRFWIKCDDGSRLFMNTNIVDGWDPTGAMLIAWNGGSSGTNYGTGSRYQLNGIYMAAGQKYYYEFVHAEGTGGDGYGITYTINSTTTPASTTLIPVSELQPVLGPIAIAELSPMAPLNYMGPTTFRVKGITGAGPYNVQWYKNGQPIPGAQGYKVTLNLVAADAGAVIACTIGNTFSSATVSTTLAFEQDSTPLAIASLRSSPRFDGVTVVFNKLLDDATAYNPANYQLGGGLQLLGITVRPDRRTVFLKTSWQDEYTPYTLTISGLADAGPSATPVTIATNFTSHFLVQGFVRAERYDEVGFPGFVGPGVPSQGLYINPKFINNQPDFVGPRNTFNYTSANPTLDWYGATVYGWFVPPVSGNYTFYSRADDGSELFLNPAGMSADGKVLVSRPMGANLTYDNGENAEPRYSVASLVGGQRYYIEGNFQEGTGGDAITGVIRGPNDYSIPPATEPAALGQWFLMPVAPENRTDVFFLQEPGTASVLGGQTATFNVVASGVDTSWPAQLVWEREMVYGSGVFTPVPYGFGSPFTTPPMTEPTNRFRVTAYSASGMASAIATVLVTTPDTAGPIIIGANVPNARTSVKVMFDEPVNATDANTLANYRITDGERDWVITGVALQPDGKSVVLTMGETFWPGGAYVVVVNNIKDILNPPNTMNPDTLYKFWAPDGLIVRKQYTFTSANNPASLTALYATAVWVNDQPNLTEFMNTPDKSSVGDYYAARFQGYIIPDRTGNYTFYVASDDQCEFFLSTDENPANVLLRAFEQGHANGQRNWTGAGSGRTINAATGQYNNISPTLFLQAGKAYYFQLNHREGSGGDYAGLNWRGPGDPLPVNGTVSIIGAAVLSSPNMHQYASVTPLPAAITTNELATVTYAPVITGYPNLAIQWRANGVAISGATGRTFTTPALTFASHNNIAYDVVVSSAYNTVTSTPSVITVVQDTTAPSIVAAQGGFRGTREFFVKFSEPVLAANATNPANYTIAGGAAQLTVASVALLGGQSSVLLTLTPAPDEGAEYTITAANIADNSSLTNAAASLNATVTAWKYSPNFVYYEKYTNITGSTIANLTGAAKYQALAADITGFTNVLSYGNNQTDALWNNYGAVLRGFFTPTSSGPYQIYLAHDDGAFLRASIDDNPANAATIISSDAVQGTFADGVHSFTNDMVQGQRYFLEGAVKEGGGGDYLRVGARPAITDNMDPMWDPSTNVAPLRGSVLGVFAPPATLAITQQPASVETLPYRTVTFSVAAQATPASAAEFIVYQWQTNGVDVPGATGPTLTIGPVPPEQTLTTVSVTVMAPGAAAVTSDVANLTLGVDAEGPVALWAATLDGTQVLVRFNEFLDVAGMSDSSLFTVNGDNVFASALVQADQQTVLLTPLVPLTTDVVINVQLAVDYSQVNLSYDLNVPMQHYRFTSADIGALTAPSVVGLVDNQTFSVQTDGADIWGAADAGNLLYRPVTGDFDISVRVKSLFLANAWTKAGIMARESTNAASFNQVMFTTPRGGQNTFSHQWRDPATSPNSQSSGDVGLVRPPIADYPNNWVRLVRQGNSFTSYYSFDGVNWNLHYTRNSILARTLLVGFAVTSHDVAIRTTALFDNLYFPPAPTFSVQPTPDVVSVAVGGSTSLTAEAVNPPNSGPLTYQWLRNGEIIAGANAATLNLSNLQVADSGSYVLIIGNHGGETWSSPAVVTVVNQRPLVGADNLTTSPNTPVTVPLAQLTGNDSDPDGTPLAFQRLYAGQPRVLNYNFNDGLLPADTAIFGNTRVDLVGGVNNGGVLKLTDAVANQSGAFLVNDAAITAMPVGEFTLRAKVFIGNGNATPADGMSFNLATNLPDAGVTTAEAGVGNGFSVTIDTYPTDIGIEVIVGSWKLYYPLPSIVMTGYQDVYIHMDPDGTVDVALNGVTYFNNIQTPYQPISGGRFGIYGRTGGSYETHWVDNLTIEAIPSQTLGGGSVALVGDNVTYTPAPGTCGRDTFYYSVTDGQVDGQVFQEVSVILQEVTPENPVFVTPIGNPALGAGTNHLATLPDYRSLVEVSDNGCYVTLVQTPAPGTEAPIGQLEVTIVATDGIGLTATNTGTVTVFPTVAPLVTQQPTNTTVNVGATATLTVAAIGGDPLVVQWYKDGMPVDGGNSTTLTISNVQATAQGTYTAELSNSAGSTYSEPATLTVNAELVRPTVPLPLTGGGQLNLTVDSVVGQWYWIEYKNDLNDAEWTKILPAKQGTGAPLTLEDLNPNLNKRFYRIAVSYTEPQ